MTRSTKDEIEAFAAKYKDDKAVLAALHDNYITTSKDLERACKYDIDRMVEKFPAATEYYMTMLS